VFNDQSTGDVKFTCRRVAAAVSDLKIHGFALDGIHSGLTVTVNKKLRVCYLAVSGYCFSGACFLVSLSVC